MPFSHHSHSGQFCPGHAKDSLEEVILTAISRDMDVFATTEHMPRHEEDRYPEEIEPFVTLAAQRANESAYVSEALRLREKYQARINIPIGFEGEWIRPESADLIIESIDTHRYDFFVGSVHHVHTIPIDYDHQMYRDARTKSGGTDEKLFQDYFDAQLAMLQAVKPPVVGHFDLIRLKSDNPNASLSDLAGVWPRILRNLDFIATYGGVLEINSAALRKGLEEPYPQRLICQAALERGLRFCLSDDSHGKEQVAVEYQRVLDFLEDAGIESLAFLKYSSAADKPSVDRFQTLQIDQIGLTDLRAHPFWKASP